MCCIIVTFSHELLVLMFSWVSRWCFHFPLSMPADLNVISSCLIRASMSSVELCSLSAEQQVDFLLDLL